MMSCSISVEITLIQAVPNTFSLVPGPYLTRRIKYFLIEEIKRYYRKVGEPGTNQWRQILWFSTKETCMTSHLQRHTATANQCHQVRCSVISSQTNVSWVYYVQANTLTRLQSNFETSSHFVVQAGLKHHVAQAGFKPVILASASTSHAYQIRTWLNNEYFWRQLQLTIGKQLWSVPNKWSVHVNSNILNQKCFFSDRRMSLMSV